MHNPILSAKQFATIDLLAEGRFTLGVGVGGREEDYTAIDSNWSDRRWAILEKNVRTMKSVWSKDFHKEMGPNTYSKTGPQILAGAVGPKAMSMSADFAEGLAGFSFNADLKEIKDSFVRVKEAFIQKKISPRLVTDGVINLHKAGLESISTDMLETHFLAGGNVQNVVSALIASDKASIPLTFETATAIDLAGRDVNDAVKTSVYPKVIDCPTEGKVSAVAKRWYSADGKSKSNS